VPFLYIGTNPGVDFRTWPQEQQIQRVLGTDVKNAIWVPKEVNEHFNNVAKNSSKSWKEGFCGKRMASFMKFCIAAGIHDFPDSGKIDFCAQMGNPFKVKMSYLVASFGRQPRHMEAWTLMHEVLPRLREERATYGDFLAALTSIRLKAASMPPRPLSSQPFLKGGNTFSNRLLKEIELAWATYNRLQCHGPQLKASLLTRLPSGHPEAVEELAAVLNSLPQPQDPKKKMTQHMFFTQMHSTTFDILMWMIWEAGSGEETVRRMLHWAGVDNPNEMDLAVSALAEKAQTFDKQKSPFFVSGQEITCITDDAQDVFEGLAHALLKHIGA